MITVSISHDLDKVIGWAKWIAEDQVPFALAKTLTKTAQDVRAAEYKAMEDAFEGPTRWTLNSLYLRPAKKSNMEATVWLKDTGDTSSKQYLATQIEGGKRKFKRFEKALFRAGILPRGFVVVPGSQYPKDGYGNVKGSFITQLLSYFSAFEDGKGYTANMTDKRRDKLANRGLIERDGRKYKTINGVQYFVSRGRGEYTGANSWQHGRKQHLHAGIWAKTGIHGSSMTAVFMFVPAARYKSRFKFVEVASQVIANRMLPNWHAAWRDAMATRR